MSKKKAPVVDTTKFTEEQKGRVDKMNLAFMDVTNLLSSHCEKNGLAGVDALGTLGAVIASQIAKIENVDGRHAVKGELMLLLEKGASGEYEWEAEKEKENVADV